MRTFEEGDAIRDALGLIQCAHTGDYEGGRVILDNGDIRLVCAALARISADLIEDFTEDPDEMLDLMRQRHG